MKKSQLLKIINTLLFLAFLISAVSMLLYRYGPSSLRGHESVYEFHEWAGILLFILALFHLILNWGWIRSNLFKKSK